MLLTCLFCRCVCARYCGVRLVFALVTLGSVAFNVFFFAWLNQKNQLHDIVDLDTLTALIPDEVVRIVNIGNLDRLIALPILTARNGNNNNHQRNKNNQEKSFLRFDEAAPREVQGMSRTHWLPNAVPQRRLIPNDQVENETYHIKKRTNSSTSSIVGEKGRNRPFYSDTPNSGTFNWEHHSYEQDHRALYLYNPAILPLVRDDPDTLSDQDWEALTGGDVHVHYLATFRANTGGNCFGSDRPEVMKAGQQISYLAVALLDENLDIIPKSDVLIDINAGPSFGKYFNQFHEDCKPIQMRGKIYFLCNECLFRVQIRRKSAASENSPTAIHTGRDRKLPYRYPNIYGDGLEITLLNRQKIAGGKNFNVFRVPLATNHTDNTQPPSFDYYLQDYPLPHRYHRLIVPNRDKPGKVGKDPKQQSSTLSLPSPSFDGPDTAHTITTCPENDRPGTWITNCTQPETKPFFGDKDHGTACCATLSLSPGQHVLVGISHTKTSGIRNPWWTRDIYGRYNGHRNETTIKIGAKRYLSRLVAYRSQPPFDVVARSGWFCLGFGGAGEPGGNGLAGRNLRYTLDLFRDSYECPHVHFASGIAEHAADPSKVVISYGVADCYPRMIVVEKEDLARRLLGTV